MAEKTEAELLAKELLNDEKSGWTELEEGEQKQIFAFCDDYTAFLNEVKTEREAVCFFVKELEKQGYKPYEHGKAYKKGDKAYINNRGKAIAIIKFGEKPVEEGLKIVAAHIDSPRLDLKPNPLYEDSELCYLKTHYYGGIRKYQWPSIPLALRGTVIKADGSKVYVNIGDSDSDPCFVVNDLLPHLATEQSQKPLHKAIAGEDLNILIGNIPFKDGKTSEAVKLNIAKILFDKYGIKEKDFVSAELCAVPAFKAKDIGFDRSMIGAYGHDDKVCAYTAARSILDSGDVTNTTVVLLADKEEIGSEGNTGMNSDFLRNIAYDLAAAEGSNGWIALENSKCMSADVTCAYDPNYASVYEKRNSAILGRGVGVMKYTGARGKSGTNDASAEYMGHIRAMLDKANVIWQVGELGAVDAGGGGTVAMFIADLGVDTVDVGVPVLGMHSPFETVSKLDTYMAYKAFNTFIK